MATQKPIHPIHLTQLQKCTKKSNQTPSPSHVSLLLFLVLTLLCQAIRSKSPPILLLFLFVVSPSSFTSTDAGLESPISKVSIGRNGVFFVDVEIAGSTTGCLSAMVAAGMYSVATINLDTVSRAARGAKISPFSSGGGGVFRSSLASTTSSAVTSSTSNLSLSSSFLPSTHPPSPAACLTVSSPYILTASSRRSSTCLLLSPSKSVPGSAGISYRRKRGSGMILAFRNCCWMGEGGGGGQEGGEVEGRMRRERNDCAWVMEVDILLDMEGRWGIRNEEEAEEGRTGGEYIPTGIDSTDLEFGWSEGLDLQFVVGLQLSSLWSWSVTRGVNFWLLLILPWFYARGVFVDHRSDE
ncbi:hypothetical protein K440DRAFT_284125 [Wilcoxina mikolae CBS 423.85]|nr:hypothetical protein K440DRAFT_284125 [Wilcoxina mikolae CBS 423.85]